MVKVVVVGVVSTVQVPFTPATLCPAISTMSPGARKWSVVDVIKVGLALDEDVMLTAAGLSLCTYQNWKRSASIATSAICGTVRVRWGLTEATVITAVK